MKIAVARMRDAAVRGSEKRLRRVAEAEEDDLWREENKGGEEEDMFDEVDSIGDIYGLASYRRCCCYSVSKSWRRDQ